MATYVTKRCPHCGYAYQIHQSGEQRKYGCPYKTCIRCQQSYWDTDIKEPALHGYNNTYEILQSIRRIICILICAPVGILCFVGGLLFIVEGEMAGLFLIAMGGFVAWIIGSYIKGKIYEKKYRDEVIASQQRGYDASMVRLKNTNYLTALAEHDYLARKLLQERINGNEEHYAKRPQ